MLRPLVLHATLLSVIQIGGLPASAAPSSRRGPVDFGREVRPILAEKCFACHGPDASKRDSDLRLDTRQGPYADLGGYAAVVPGRPDQSALVQRITSGDPKKRMPKADSGKTLSDHEIAILREWIVQGAEWKEHWAFVAPKRPAPPAVGRADWARNEIDRFVLARLEEEGLAPSPEADRATLIRRLTLDLTGLPPIPQDVKAFLEDDSPGAYHRVVDRLLGSPRHAERMAMDWLDLARFADTDGYEVDHTRSMWPWRDWVIDAFDRNMPFDQFTVEQLAGDLLPAATRRQKVATGFNRNHRINREAGTIPEEWRVEYVMDRVNTTAAVWLGLTMGCARCHDHKYDPLSQTDFYQLFAFFNNVPEVGNGGARPNAPPLARHLTAAEETRAAELEGRLDAARREVHTLKQRADSPADLIKAAEEKAAALEKELQKFLEGMPSTMVMAELDMPRDTFVLTRGEYSKPGARVSADVPAILPPLPAAAPKNRLALARWLVSPHHPLTARVTVNRFWMMYFGRGLVRTVDDLGTQGEPPTHPDLLDWLATEFIRSGWDLKAMQKQIVTSATYRQSSRTTPAARRADPDNLLLARASRLRLPAEFVRDQALFAGGLLVPKVGGPSVNPYQPPGVWDGVAYKVKYVQGHGEDLYRRSIYTFWKRTVPPPAMTILDAPSREICRPSRSTTNTPLQSLLLMNDTTYVEAARFLGQRMILEGGSSSPQRLEYGFRLVLASAPKADELRILHAALERYLRRYSQDRAAVEKLLAVGESPPDQRLEAAELAAYTAIGSVILNLDQTITRE